MKKLISIVIPTYNEEENIVELVARLLNVIKTLDQYSFELIFVDDGSSDQTPQILKELNAKNEAVKTIRFQENNGSHMAILAGCHHAKGDCAIIMAADLQDPPELIGDLLKEWEKGGNVVWGLRVNREGESLITKICSQLYYLLVNVLTTVKVPPKGADVFLADRVVLNKLASFNEKPSSVFLLIASYPLIQNSIEYDKARRYKGKSKWSLKKKICLAFGSIASFHRFKRVQKKQHDQSHRPYKIAYEIF